MQYKQIKFSGTQGKDFVQTLRKRVQAYFKDNNISRQGDYRMIVKTVVMLAIYFIPYVLIITNSFSNIWLITLMWFMMGMGMAGLGLAVMHDACHGAYSKNRTVNRIVGLSLNMLGGNAKNWKMQHNVLHHTYTNIHGMDEDISPPPGILRFSPHEKLNKIHRYQHLYGWFFYGLMTMAWITIKDFMALNRYHKMGLTKSFGKSYSFLVWEIILSKIFYFTYCLVLPLIFVDLPWYIIVLQFLLLHFVAGLVLAMIFQPAHVMPTTEYPMPDEDGNIENNAAIHQVLTTTNFAPKKRLFSWFVGGLNYQIEHHLFPNICHVHYRKISKIVEETVREYGLPYHSQRSFRKALLEHANFLKRLGREEHIEGWIGHHH